MSNKVKQYLILSLILLMVVLYSWLWYNSGDTIYVFPLSVFIIATILWIVVINMIDKHDAQMEKYKKNKDKD